MWLCFGEADAGPVGAGTNVGVEGVAGKCVGGEGGADREGGEVLWGFRNLGGSFPASNGSQGGVTW